MEAFPAWVATLTPSGLLLLAVLLILTGKLLPERTHTRIVEDKDEQLRVQARQVEKLVENSETTLHLIRSLPSVSEERAP